MLQHHKFENLGSANHGWLNAKHHFSFGNYFEPTKLSHGELVVINDDRIAPQTGFDTHPHRDMEIITYVRKGAITHQDNAGNKGRTSAGNVQVMSAGTGILHSEFNFEDEETNIYQIWIEPERKSLTPKWDAAEFPTKPVVDALPLLVSGDGNAPLHINQDARIFAGQLDQGTGLNHKIVGKAYLLVSEGAVMVNGILAKMGDGISIEDEKVVNLTAKTNVELLIIEVPGLNDAR